ncbi:MAG: polysaccharide deacetylase family protein [Candidatus Eiseniibacteriota bacterium]
MRVVLRFDRSLADVPEARWAIETIASLLETPWRTESAGAGADAGDAVVFVGLPAQAPRDAAAVVPWEDEGPWMPDSLAVATFEGEPLVCPHGRFDPPGAANELPRPWLRSAFSLLVREEERLDPRRDQWECFSGTFSRLHALGVLDRALVSAQAGQLARRIETFAAARGQSLERRVRWRGGARFAVALTHDVDDMRLYSFREAWRLLRQSRSSGSYAFRAGISLALRTLGNRGRGPDPYWSFDRWVALEERHGFRSSFYFCSPQPSRRHEYDATYGFDDPVAFEGRALRVRDLVRTLADRGFDVGLHGAYESHRDAAELTREKGQIEEAAGRRVPGTRQHFLRFDVSRTFSAQEAAGFDYDTTLGYNEAIGFRAGIAGPFHPWDASARKPHGLLELPLTVMDGTLFRTLGLDGAAAAERVRAHLDEVERTGGLAVLLWHPNGADTKRFPGWWSSYESTLEHLAGRDAWVTDAATIAAWWRERREG